MYDWDDGRLLVTLVAILLKGGLLLMLENALWILLWYKAWNHTVDT